MRVWWTGAAGGRLRASDRLPHEVTHVRRPPCQRLCRLPAHRRPRPGRGRAADPGGRGHADLAGVRRAGPPDRRRPARPRRPAGRHGRPDADQPARVRARRRRGDAPGRRPVLALQHLVGRAGRLPVRQRRQPGRGLRGRDPRRRLRRRRRPRPRGVRRRRAARHADAGRARGDGPGRLRLRRGVAVRRARRPGHADLHLGHHRPAEGRADHPPPRPGAAPGDHRGGRRPGGGPDHLVPAVGAHRGPGDHAVPRGGAGRAGDLRGRRPDHRRRAGRHPPDDLVRGAPGLGEAQGRAGGHGPRARPGHRTRAAARAAPRRDRAGPVPVGVVRRRGHRARDAGLLHRAGRPAGRAGACRR